jgi:hypothetical protein
MSPTSSQRGKAKQYAGRLAFDPDSGFHIDPEGNRLVTDDGGKSWRYATEADSPHNHRYQKKLQVVDSTANKLLELQLEHGREKAEELMREQHPHHFDVQPDDAHFDGVLSDPDHIAETITSHTDAYA